MGGGFAGECYSKFEASEVKLCRAVFGKDVKGEILRYANVSTVGTCEKACEDDEGCGCFVFMPNQANPCHLKKKESACEKVVPVSDDVMFAGKCRLPGIHHAGTGVHRVCNPSVSGMDTMSVEDHKKPQKPYLTSSGTTLGECEKLCASSDKCGCYTWHKDKCRLKTRCVLASTDFSGEYTSGECHAVHETKLHTITPAPTLGR